MSDNKPEEIRKTSQLRGFIVFNPKPKEAPMVPEETEEKMINEAISEDREDAQEAFDALLDKAAKPKDSK